MSYLVLNPFIRILLDQNGEECFILENLESKKTFQVSSKVLKILNFCCKPRTFEEIKKFIAENLTLKIKKPDEVLDQLINSSILISKSKYQDKLKKYDIWLKYDWWMPLHYFLSTENIQVSDKTDPKSQIRILNKYLNNRLPQFYKTYYHAKKIDLPKPGLLHKGSLLEVIMRRRTSRSFAFPIDVQQLSTILYYGCEELKAVREFQRTNYKNNPIVLLQSLFTPFEVYVVANKTESLDEGIYHYNIELHSLELLKNGDYRKKMMDIAQGQTFLFDAATIILISAVFERFMFRYRQPRAYRELLTTASELAHLLILYATTLGVKTFETPALKDSQLSDLLGIDGWSEEALYLLALGK